jgi:hypothetical protein
LSGPGVQPRILGCFCERQGLRATAARIGRTRNRRGAEPRRAVYCSRSAVCAVVLLVRLDGFQSGMGMRRRSIGFAFLLLWRMSSSPLWPYLDCSQISSFYTLFVTSNLGTYTWSSKCR